MQQLAEEQRAEWLVQQRVESGVDEQSRRSYRGGIESHGDGE